MRLLRILALPLALVATALLSACTGVGDGGQSGVDDFLARGATVVSDGATPNRYVDFVKVSGDRTSACIAIEAHRDVFDLFAVAFTVSYDPAMLRYSGFIDSDSCLGTGAAVLPTQVDTSAPGRIIVGQSRNSATTSTGVTCGRVVQLCFDVIGEGDTRLEFTGNRALLASDGSTITNDWVGATVQTRL